MIKYEASFIGLGEGYHFEAPIVITYENGVFTLDAERMIHLLSDKQRFIFKLKEGE